MFVIIKWFLFYLLNLYSIFKIMVYWYSELIYYYHILDIHVVCSWLSWYVALIWWHDSLIYRYVLKFLLLSNRIFLIVISYYFIYLRYIIYINSLLIMTALYWDYEQLFYFFRDYLFEELSIFCDYCIEYSIIIR